MEGRVRLATKLLFHFQILGLLRDFLTFHLTLYVSVFRQEAAPGIYFSSLVVALYHNRDIFLREDAETKVVLSVIVYAMSYLHHQFIVMVDMSNWPFLRERASSSILL